MSKVKEQIAELTRHLFEQHQAAKAPVLEDRSLLVHVLGGGVERIDVQAVPPVVVRSVPLAPGVHPMMQSRFVPGRVEVQQHVRTKAEALEAVERMYGEEPVFKREQLGTWSDGEDDVPSIDAPAEKKSYKRKLEP
jgi:hypothetical protein